MRSDNVKKGMQQAPHRSLFNALGFTEEEMKKPMVGIVSSYNEIVPGHMNLDKIVNAVKLGVAEAGGVPVVFPAIAVCDGIAMGHIGMKYSLVTRDLIADSTECMALAHQFDALVMVPNCDKNVPGLLMAAARINVPTVFVSGGPMLAGHVKGQKRSLSSMFEAVGANAAGTMTEEEVREFEEKVCPTCGSCSGTSRKRNNSGCLFRKDQACKACRYGSYGNAQKRYQTERYHDKGCNLKCTDSRYGSRMLYKLYAASAGDRT